MTMRTNSLLLVISLWQAVWQAEAGRPAQPVVSPGRTGLSYVHSYLMLICSLNLKEEIQGLLSREFCLALSLLTDVLTSADALLNGVKVSIKQHKNQTCMTTKQISFNSIKI